MADASRGPVSTLPGSWNRLPAGTPCDQHPDRVAVYRVQGETDSFGCEYQDVCEECRDQLLAYLNSSEVRTGNCDWCRFDATDLRDARDYEEGLAGRVYRVCGPCLRRRNERAAEELSWESD